MSDAPTRPAPAAAPPSVECAGLPQAWRIEVFRAPEYDDPAGVEALAAARELGIESIRSLRLGRGYLLPPELDRAQVERIVRELLADPVIDRARLVEPGQAPVAEAEATEGGARHRILVARRPGVMDPVALTIERALRRAALVGDETDLLVATFRAWEAQGTPTRDELSEFARRVLANEVIEELAVDSESLSYGRPAAGARHGRVEVALREATPEALDEISKSGALSLSREEMLCVQGHYRELGREPSACELETLAQTWSEHCQHKTFRGTIEMDGEVIENLLKSTLFAVTRELDKPWCLSVFHDNAGVIEFDDELGVAIKVETHNHPSAIDPYGGAGTGIGGVIRDILGVGLGARPIANTDAFFVGPSDLPLEEVPKGSMHPRRILRGVVAGVRDYGNRMGIPTVSGGVWFDEGYVANPLVFCGTIGMIPKDCVEKEVRPGDVILLIGGRTGRDGIHGATFSSVELSEESEMVSAAAVQIGDPITEKRVLDGLLVARDRRLYRAVTDCGAGGLSSAVGEMGARCGAEVELEKVPLKYPGLAPEEIWISEAQERMVLAVPPDSLEDCLAALASEEVEATPIGRFTDSGELVLRHDGEEVGRISMDFLHEGNPRPTRRASWSAPTLADPGCPPPEDWNAALCGLLARPSVASKEWLVRQYDHEVQGMSVVKPMVGVRADGPSDAAVLAPKTRTEGRVRGLALACGASARYGRLDPGAMAEAVIDEALRNVVSVGGDPEHTALLDNFAWGNCDKPQQLGALVHAARGCQRAAVAFGTPFVSGKDSLNNEYRVGDETLSIPPTLLVTALAIVPNVARCVTMDVKKAGNLVLLVGPTRAELGGSEYHAMQGLEGGQVPRPDLKNAPDLLKKLHAAMKLGQIVSCHDLSEGGLAVAAAEMCLAGGLGMDLDLSQLDHEDYPAGYDESATLLFSESCTRFLIEVEPGKKFNLQTKLMGHPATPLGRVSTSAKLKIKGSTGALLVDQDLDGLQRAFQGGFQG